MNIENTKTIEVYKDGNVWIAKQVGAARATAIRNTQSQAISAAKNIALKQGLTISVYNSKLEKPRVIKPRETTQNENCFITTACVKYYGLDDDCYELNILRKFRDNYLLQTTENSLLVEQYYNIAPKLVELLEKDKNKHILFAEIFQQIKLACIAIENKEFEEAKSIYKGAIINLYNHFPKIQYGN